MKEYRITTTSTCYTNYIVKAKNEQKAEEEFFNGNFESEDITDYADENIIEIKEYK